MLSLLANQNLKLTSKFGLIIPKIQRLKTVKLNRPNRIDQTLRGNMKAFLGPPMAEPKIIVLSQDNIRENAGGL